MQFSLSSFKGHKQKTSSYQTSIGMVKTKRSHADDKIGQGTTSSKKNKATPAFSTGK